MGNRDMDEKFASADEQLQRLRERMLRLMLLAIVVSGAVAVLNSFLSGDAQALWHLGVFAAIVGIAAFSFWSYLLRFLVLYFALFAFALLELLGEGTSGIHSAFLLLGVFITSVLMGRAWALAAMFFSIATVIVCAFLIIHGYVTVQPGRLELSDDWNDWLYIPLLIVVGSSVIISTTHYLLTRLVRNLDRSLGLVEELQESVARHSAAEQELIESEERYRLLAENIHDVVYTRDMELKSTYISPSVYSQRGYTVEEAANLSMTELLDSDALAEFMSTLQEELALEGKADPNRSRMLEYQLPCKDGRKIWVESVMSFLRDKDGQPTGMLGVQRDITERKEAEEERAAIQQEMQQMQKMEGLGMMAGGIAHDFNNILLAIMGNADLALNTMEPLHDARDNVEEILENSRRAADLCKQLLAYSGKGRFQVVPIELSEFVREMTGLMELSIGKKINMKYELADSGTVAEVDATQMRQVLMNLVINASESIGDKAGSISIQVSAQDCDRACLEPFYQSDTLPEGPYVKITVEDTGSGMDEETRSQIFTPFFSTKQHGHGLGLAAVLGVVRSHGGMMEVDSKKGEGTTFTMYLPASDKNAVSLQRTAVSAVKKKGHGVVLVVDDEAAIRTFTQSALESAGYTVLLASDGEEALALYREHADDVRLVLLDLTMPVMSGEETLAELEKIRPDVRVLLSSGFSEQDVSATLRNGAATGFLQKPYSVQMLIDGVEEFAAHSPNDGN